MKDGGKGGGDGDKNRVEEVFTDFGGQKEGTVLKSRSVFPETRTQLLFLDKWVKGPVLSGSRIFVFPGRKEETPPSLLRRVRR